MKIVYVPNGQYENENLKLQKDIDGYIFNYYLNKIINYLIIYLNN